MSHTGFWGESMPGRGKSKCKSPEMGTFLLSSESSSGQWGWCGVCMGRDVVGNEVREAAGSYAVQGLWTSFGEDLPFIMREMGVTVP